MECTEQDLDDDRHTDRFIAWLMAEGFLQNANLRQRCMVPMHFEKVKHAGTDKYCWRCPRGTCRQRASVREGSFFAHSRMTLRKQFRILLNFVIESSAVGTAMRVRVDRGTVTDFFDRARRCYSHDLVTNPITFNYGNEYEADELLIKGVRDTHGHHFRQWVGGLFERQTGKCIYYRVADRSTPSLIPPIIQHIPQGSFVYSDDWRPYRSLPNHNFYHSHVNHSNHEYVRVEHVGPVDLTVHINNLEGLNAAVRGKLRNRSRRTIARLDLALAELDYRHSGGFLFDPFKI